ncbi:hypothetical protein Tco_0517554 [Tanacetum coccineum]
MVDSFVVVVVKVVLGCRHWKDCCMYQEWWRCYEMSWPFYLLKGCRKVVRRFEDGHVDGMEKLELLFEQDIDVEEWRFEGDEDGGEV